MRILVTGGSGYTGAELVPALLGDGHTVLSLDVEWFGDNLVEHERLTKIRGDVRELENIDFDGIDSIIHLANIANDPAVELNSELSWEVNVLAAQQIAEKAISSGVRQIIYASSGSVYGVKEEEEVTEELSLLPISTYNKTKMVAERVLLSYSDEIKVHCIRPATICGFSQRMRLDVSVNMLTFQALKHGVMTVFGGGQIRPNINIRDIVDVYRHFLGHSGVAPGCYNAGFENLSILEIAELIQELVGGEIRITKSNDPRSYRQDSRKLLNTGFCPRYSVKDAIIELSEKYSKGLILDQEKSYTVKWMKKLGLADGGCSDI